MDERQIKWDKRFLNMSEVISDWSKDPSTKVGAIITNDIKIISMGYNGLPQSTPDYPEILNVREIKYQYIIHAEVNAVLSAKQDLKGCTIYTSPFLPCPRCASILVQSGISRIVSSKCQDERWKQVLKESKYFMKLSGLEVVEY